MTVEEIMSTELELDGNYNARIGSQSFFKYEQAIERSDQHDYVPLVRIDDNDRMDGHLLVEKWDKELQARLFGVGYEVVRSRLH